MVVPQKIVFPVLIVVQRAGQAGTVPRDAPGAIVGTRNTCSDELQTGSGNRPPFHFPDDSALTGLAPSTRWQFSSSHFGTANFARSLRRSTRPQFISASGIDFLDHFFDLLRVLFEDANQLIDEVIEFAWPRRR